MKLLSQRAEPPPAVAHLAERGVNLRIGGIASYHPRPRASLASALRTRIADVEAGHVVITSR